MSIANLIRYPKRVINITIPVNIAQTLEENCCRLTLNVMLENVDEIFQGLCYCTPTWGKGYSIITKWYIQGNEIWRCNQSH